MGRTDRVYRLRIRDAADAADLLVITSVSGGVNPYITEAPTGDGESFDPITGKPTTGAYSVRVADPAPDPDTPQDRVVTSALADVNARQQLIARKVWVETSTNNGSTWSTMVVGYVTAVRLITAITYEFAIGQSRRIEQSREIFKNATVEFPSTTSIIGGPILGGFGSLVDDNGGWRFYVNQVHSSPNYIQIKLTTGFDPRKDPSSTFSSVSSAITDYENNYARPYFEPFASSSAFVTGPDIQGSFPRMRVLLKPVSPAYNATTNPNRLFVPLSEPDPAPGAWWTSLRTYDNLTRSGVSSLWLPKDCVNADTGEALTFEPSVSDTFDVYVYAVPVSENNPLHYVGHPVDLWKKLRDDAGIAYDSSVLAALKDLVNAANGGGVIEVALRITQSSKLADFDTSTIFGPFRLSSRVVDGEEVLFSTLVRGRTPVQTITLADLRSDATTLFDLDEQTVITAITLKTLRLFPWSTAEKDQPNADSIVSITAPSQTLENASDDIPSGLDHEVGIGDIPGMILRDGVPVNFEAFISRIGDEMFQRFGRGAITCELACLPSVTAQVGDLVTLDLPHMPGAAVGQTPVSQRGTARNFQVVQRTEIPEGCNLKLVDATVQDAEEVGNPGGSGPDTETDVTAATPPDPIAFPAGSGASATWADTYPQFAVRIAWEAHAPSEVVFDELFDGETDLLAGTTSHTRPSIGTGWVARCRIQYFTATNTSSWSSYSNEVTIDDTSPSTPGDVPSSLGASSTVFDEAHGAWTNPVDTTDLIRINWQASTEISSPSVWYNVAGGNRLLAANTTSDDQATGGGTFARFRVAYVNSEGVTGPYSDWSSPTPIAT